MTAAPVRLLLLEDNRADADLLQAALAKFAPGGFAITHVERLADAFARIRAGQFDALLSDLGLPDSTGLATVRAIAAGAPTLPLVVMTGFDDDELGRAAIQHGAQDYLVKGEKNGTLIGRTLRYAIERKRLEIELRAANEALAGRVAERTAELEAANAVVLANAAGYRQLFDANPHPMYMCDPETLRFIAVNDAAVTHYGWSREEFLSMTMAEIRPAEETQRLRDHIARMRREHIGEAGLWKHRKKDGTLIDVEISSHAIEFGWRRARVVLALDITERKQAEQALRAAEEQFRGLVEQSIAGSYIIQDGKLAYVNPRFAQILGYDSAEELIGRDGLEVVAEKDRAFAMENRRRVIEGEVRSTSYTFTALKKDGATVEVGAHSTRATHRGRPAMIGLLQDISEKQRAEKEIQRYIAQLETAFKSTVEVATIISEMRDPYTAGHERRVAEIAVAIGAELGFEAHRQEGLQVAGHLHDIGKVTIPAEILSKPGKLSAIELRLIQGHAQASYDVLKGVEFPWPVAQVALQHHERMDGSGYPQGLKGETILLEARIMAVADVVEVMSSHRPYRAGLGIEKALAEIERGRGAAYDADAADACLRLFREKRYELPA